MDKPDTENQQSHHGEPAWHKLDVDQLLDALQADENGLDRAEVDRRLEKYGFNRLPAPAPRPAWRRLLAQFHNVLIYALIGAAVLALALDHGLDAAVIAAVVAINAIIGFVQEGRAEAAMAAIDKMLAQTATIRRQGCWDKYPAEQLVPGDIVRISDGDRVPADLRLIQSHGLRIEQAALTGESVPVSKHHEPVAKAAALADRRSMAYSGTLVVGGQAVGVVVATGSQTEIGRISTMISEVEQLTTPLILQINRFGHHLTLLLLCVTAIMIASAWWLHDMRLADGFVAGVALIVAAIPEGLPAIITITLAIGVRRMAWRHAIIRRLPAVETLGSVTVICSDKTGTLTQNRLRAAKILLLDDTFAVDDLDPSIPGLGEILRAGPLCNLAEPGSKSGDPLETALLELAESTGLNIAQARSESTQLEMVPFSSSSKWMATVHPNAIMIKGAPEVLIEHADSVLDDGDDGREHGIDRDAWRQRLDTLAGEGYRLLALADARSNQQAAEGRLPEKLRLLGIIAFEDPVRAGVDQAIAACHSAGIRVKMITGDHPDTARTVARSLGLKDADHAITGGRLDELDKAGLAELSECADVFARTTSEHKLRLVEALQASGEVVAMTGDGANDAPALKRADIGVSMGIKGTEAAHEASEMVLTDDNFSTIVAGIEEGRGVYGNIRKALLFILPTNAGEALVILLAVMAGLALPLTPVQVLWVNLATAVTLALALAFEPLENDVMRLPPRDPQAGLVTRRMVARILWVGLFLTAAVFFMFQQVLDATGNEALARGVALNMLVTGEVVYLFNCRRWSAPSWTLEALTANPVAWLSVAVLAGLQAALTYWPPLQQVFGLTGLGPNHWLMIGGVSLLLFVLVEIEKWVIRRRQARKRSATGG
ncbi:MAG: HAD-IC family P-type ATPase [Wenzhouxiangellaceae bacterium]|nr:HAD-IC family P-type ATPase [Wenzhouxiangellaceae bacterium]